MIFVVPAVYVRFRWLGAHQLHVVSFQTHALNLRGASKDGFLNKLIDSSFAVRGFS